jgi:hypothetical protein
MHAQTVDWATIGPLPIVSPWNKGHRSLTWAERGAGYAALPKRGLVVTAELVTPVVHAEENRTHLDSILSSASLTTHPVASRFPGEACCLPLPLELVWVSPDGHPLWACSPLVPATETLSTREYWHKRYPSHRAEFGDKVSALTTAGRYREYRTPIHAESVSTLHAVCVGNREEVERLLAVVSHIGKKGSMGYGRVARWTVIESDHTLSDVLPLRAVPDGYFEGQESFGIQSPPRGWTPPYWFAPWWLPCHVPA